MGWAEAVKGFLAALPALVSLMRDLVARADTLTQAINDRRLEEIRASQRQLEIEVQGIKNDEQRRDFILRLAAIERRAK